MIIGCILAGGDATRFGGIDKLGLEIEGVSIFHRLLSALTPVVDEVVVAGGVAGRARLPSVPDHVRIVCDQAPGLGPLAGLAAVLAQTDADAVVLVGGDMPYVTSAVLQRLVREYRAGRDGAAFRVHGRLQPLVAVYGRALHAHIDALLAHPPRRLGDVLEKSMANVSVLDENELASVDEHFRCMTNLNSAHDLARIRSAAKNQA